MAERRMFSKTIIDSDAFLDMPLSTQALYFHLSMRADDDGFVNNPSKIVRMIGANKNDGDLLISKKFIIPFDSGICVIKHWKIHNYIQKDRYKETVYLEEKKTILTKENGSYKLDTECIQDVSEKDIKCIQVVSKMEAQVRLGEVSEVKVKKGKEKEGDTYTEHYQLILLKSEYENLSKKFGNVKVDEMIETIKTYSKEYLKKYGSFSRVIDSWLKRDFEKNNKSNVKDPDYHNLGDGYWVGIKLYTTEWDQWTYKEGTGNLVRNRDNHQIKLNRVGVK